jgi:kynureninase
LPALQWHAEQDARAMLAHNRALTATIVAGADELDLGVVSPRDEARRGGSVMLDVPTSADPAMVVNELRAENVYADSRGATLRLSPGVVTTAGGCERLLGALRRILRS